LLPLIGRDRTVLEQLKRDWRALDFDERTRGVLAFAEKGTKAPSSVTREDLDGLRASGLGDQEILDAVLTVAMFNFVNRISSLLGVEPPPRAVAAEAKTGSST
jgi:uncharacterized peroxidase-related enzyme